METVIDKQNNKIDYLKEQIALRESIPYNKRTDKQLIKLDNLKYELRQLNSHNTFICFAN
jgi:hypothetical protein